MTPSRAADRAEHENNRDRCPVHHRSLTPDGTCPTCEADESAAETVEKRADYDGEVSVVGVAEGFRGRTHARARDDVSREQADLWRYTTGGDR